mmetsp:Transcript_45376/g.73005  ORF Transcript_45376/g.73005 Transcript_45376/m.73005 type:complete len:201 (-) Transcript_45376:121-723(-)
MVRLTQSLVGQTQSIICENFSSCSPIRISAYRLYKGDFRPGFFAIGFPVLMTLMVPLVYADINGFNQHWADVDINSGLFLICLCSVVAKKPALMEFFPEEKKALVHLPFMMKTAYTVTAIWMVYFLAIIGINLLVIWYEVSGTQSSKGTRAAFALIPTVSLIALAFCISPRLLVFFEEFYRLRDENGGGRARSLSSMLVD